MNEIHKYSRKKMCIHHNKDRISSKCMHEFPTILTINKIDELIFFVYFYRTFTSFGRKLTVKCLNKDCISKYIFS